MKRSRENHSADKPTDAQSNTEADDDGSFVGRWSRRKRDAAAEVRPPALDESIPGSHPQIDPLLNHPPSAGNGSTAAAEAEAQVQPVLTDADMPDVETLHADSDFSPFFSEGVSKVLRNRALKKLFFSGKFSARDGLDDYDDDFTKFEPLGDTVTSDMKFHARRKEKARLAALEEEERLRLETMDESTEEGVEEGRDKIDDQAISDDEPVLTQSTDEQVDSANEAELAKRSATDKTPTKQVVQDELPKDAIGKSSLTDSTDDKPQNT